MATTDDTQQDRDAAPAATPERWRKLWLAALALAACYALSGFFITGDPGKGAAVGLLVVGIFALLFVLLPRFVDTEKPLSGYYLKGLAVLIGPLVLLGLGSYRTPWYDLQDTYRAAGPAPAGLDGGREVVLLEPVDEFMVKPHSFKSATVTFADDGVYLGLYWPINLVYKPLWLPTGALTTCRPSGIDTLFTSLGVKGFGSRIEVLDPGEDVLRWCRQHQIGDGSGVAEGLR